MLCDCFVFPKCLVNQFKNSVDDLTRIRVIANEYLLYKYLIFRGALIYRICTTVHEHTQLHQQWTTSLLKHRNYNQIFRQLNLCDMLDITLSSVESFLGHHATNLHLHMQLLDDVHQTFNIFVRWHPVKSYKKTFARWRLNLRNTFVVWMMSRNSHVKEHNATSSILQRFGYLYAFMCSQGA